MPHKVLHVEDNPDDVMLVGLAFRKAGVDIKLEVATDGEKAIKMLSNGGPDAAPACVLLDIKLPTISGLDVLAWIRKQPNFKRLPVIMFTSSLLPEDINQAYDLGANSYLTKPSELDALVSLAKTIEHYWLQLNTPPVNNMRQMASAGG
jgi:CheY-like chemotaxis protein